MFFFVRLFEQSKYGVANKCEQIFKSLYYKLPLFIGLIEHIHMKVILKWIDLSMAICQNSSGTPTFINYFSRVYSEKWVPG